METASIRSLASRLDYKPLQVDMPEGIDVRQIQAGRYHVVFLTKDGKLYATGRNF